MLEPGSVYKWESLPKFNRMRSSTGGTITIRDDGMASVRYVNGTDIDTPTENIEVWLINYASNMMIGTAAIKVERIK